MLSANAYSPTHFNQPASVGADVLVTFCADFQPFRQNGVMLAMPKAPVMITSSRSCRLFSTLVILAQQFCTIAEQEELGTCYLGTTAYNAPQIVADS